MKKFLLALFFTVFTLISIAQGEHDNVKWHNGLSYESADENFNIKLGGFIMIDGIFTFPDAYYDTIVELRKGVEFRRVRLYSSGLIYNNIKYKLHLDFAGGEAVLRDTYISITKIPVVGNFNIGYFKEPFGLEFLTSCKYTTFMERGLTNPLTPQRNTGFMLFNNELDKRLYWALGYFLPSDNFGQYEGYEYHLTARLTGLPIYNTENIYKVLHLGAAVTYQFHDNSTYKLTSQPESHLIPKLLLAEIDTTKAVNQYGVETAFVYGPFCIQGEYMSVTALTANSSALQKSNYNFTAYYANVSWFITGEHKNYNPVSAAFNRVKPKKNLGSEGGAGAFEVALRYSAIDLDNTDVKGGEMGNITLGLNWYLNPATRFMFNYLLADIKNKGRINIFEMRFQIDF